ncbi:N-acyltransferase YncA, partial [Dysosmobacter welbionis]
GMNPPSGEILPPAKCSDAAPRRSGAGSTQASICQFLRQIALQLVDRQPHLLHGVPVPDGNAVVTSLIRIAHGVEVHRDAVGRADLVLPAVPLADGTGVVKVHHPVLAELRLDLTGLFGELLRKGQHRALKRRDGRMEPHDGADVVLFCIHHLFIVGFHQQGQGHPVRAQ